MNAFPTLYAMYVKEREGFDTIETHEGFATYKVQLDHCYLRDLYVRPEYRNTGVASELADRVCDEAIKAGCPLLTGTVDCRTEGFARNIRVLLAYGMDITGSHEGYVTLAKSLER